MIGRRFAVASSLGVAVALVGVAGRSPGAATAGASELHHAAIVVDTGSGGTVRKFCLSFPEESLTGAEALRRVQADPVFASYGGKGQAVCALCGVGCPSGNCFCDRSKYWAYHRAGPGGGAYTFSNAGVSSTTVQDGDVEGWRWGNGEAPPAATVGDVCNVPEPPARTASGGSATTTTTAATETTSPSPATSAPDAAAPAAGSAAPPSTFASVPAPARPGAPATTTTMVIGAAITPANGPTADVAPPVETDESGDAAVGGGTATDGGADGGAEAGDATAAAPATRGRGADAPGGNGLGNGLGLAALVGVLGGALGWRARLRRRNGALR